MTLSCVICGDAVTSSSVIFPWLKEFRVSECTVMLSMALGIYDAYYWPFLVYRDLRDSSKIKISGVGSPGHPNEREHVAPRNFNVRWDDEEYQFSTLIGISVRRRPFSTFRRRHTLHEVCFQLLQKYFGPKNVPTSRLFDICESLPDQPLGLSWGHAYGGRFYVNDEAPYSWDDPYPLYLEPPIYQPANPIDVPTLERALQEARNSLTKEKTFHFTSLASDFSTTTFDRLSLLPLEILENIAASLSTCEVKILRQTSKALAGIIPFGLGQFFWVSRFRRSSELDYIFEVRNSKKGLDWRSLYMEVMKITNFCEGLQNRKRIWNLIKSPLSDLVSLAPIDKSFLHLCRADDLQYTWKEVRAKILPSKSARWFVGCKQLYTQRVTIPVPLRQLCISIVSIGDATYVTGIRFSPCVGSDVCIGYVRRDHQQSADAESSHSDTIGLHGFILAVGFRGIHAMRYVTQAGQLSRWYGCAEGLLVTRRLVLCESISLLEAGFDVLAIPALEFQFAHFF